MEKVLRTVSFKVPEALYKQYTDVLKNKKCRPSSDLIRHIMAVSEEGMAEESKEENNDVVCSYCNGEGYYIDAEAFERSYDRYDSTGFFDLESCYDKARKLAKRPCPNCRGRIEWRKN